jgi:hypothetical protein
MGCLLAKLRLLKGLNKGFIEYYRLLTQVCALADMLVGDQPNQPLSSRRLVGEGLKKRLDPKHVYFKASRGLSSVVESKLKKECQATYDGRTRTPKAQ